jgi:hypothetical protein
MKRKILENIDAPLRDLDDKTAAALFNGWRRSALDVEFWNAHVDRWSLIEGRPTWSEHITYRARTKPTIPMSFDWSAVNSKYKYAATDKRGPSYVFEEEPTIGTDCWQSRGGIAKVDKILSSFKRGTVPWDESLIERPEWV